jgi:hypothetical protein
MKKEYLKFKHTPPAPRPITKSRNMNDNEQQLNEAEDTIIRMQQEIKILKQNAQIAINDKNHRKKILSDTVAKNKDLSNMINALKY